MAIEVPKYVRDNAARGVKYYEDGFGGDGLKEATVAEARELAAGRVTEEKVRKIGPWIARHIVDLEAPANADPEDPGYPGAGLVAMLLWGAGGTVKEARKTQAWAEQESAKLDNTANRALVNGLICDIDDTLIHDGQRIDSVYEYVKNIDAKLLLVTGRSVDDHDKTVAELKDLGIEYDELHERDFGTFAQTIDYKVYKAKKLMEEYTIVLAVDNDEEVRKAYRDLGIETLDPADINGPHDNQDGAQHMTKAITRTIAVDLRAAVLGDGNTFEGRACVYGVKDAYGTTFRSGCFTRGGLDTKPYALLWMHDPNRPVGVFTAEERIDGLYIVGQWDDSTAGREARAAATSGSASDLSVGFTWQQEIGAPEGDITKARLLEVSQVTSRFGAVPGSVLTAIRNVMDDQILADEEEFKALEALKGEAEKRAGTKYILYPDGVLAPEGVDYTPAVSGDAIVIDEDAETPVEALADQEATETPDETVEGADEAPEAAETPSTASRAAALAAYLRSLL